MTNWVRFNWNGKTHRGIQNGDEIGVCDNDLFAETNLTGATVALSEVELLAPYRPNSILALWNNFHERAMVEGQMVHKDDPTAEVHQFPAEREEIEQQDQP